MTAMVQLSGIDQGLLARLLGASGVKGAVPAGEVSPEALQAQLNRFLDELRASPEKLTPELQALLAQLLGGGNNLPDLSEAAPVDGKTLPPFAALALALSGAGAVAEDAGPVPGQRLPEVDTAETKESLQAFQQLLQEPKGKFGTVLSGAVREQLDGLLTQMASRAPAELANQPVAAGIPGGPVPGGMPPGSPGPVLSQNLLSMPVPQAVADPAWGAALGERLIWMVKGDHQLAELKISPPNLGPLEVRLNINHDQASVSFVSHHPAVRDAIEAAMPRLREMLAEQSINLVQADVGSGRQQDPGSAGAGGQGAGGLASDGDPDASITASPEGSSHAGLQRGIGLLDLFA
jgi:flagellar hook-length control protein FliK